MKKIRVLIADDHAIVREGLRQVLNSRGDIEVIGEAADGLQTLEKVKKLGPDVAVVDIAMPNLNGLEVIGSIRELAPGCHVVILSLHAKESFVRQALKNGAMGYVLKACPSADIVEAIRTAARGEYFLSARIKANVIENYLNTKETAPTARGYDLLSEREQQVFRLVVDGKSTKEIADILFVSPKTVEKHRGSISSKLGVHGRLDLLKYAIKIGVVNPELW
ncbi:MAG: response regulator transcription factor [Desulfobacterales bacterium]|nr:response regulator transcription factor [Desulfobacterales bacterium]